MWRDGKSAPVNSAVEVTELSQDDRDGFAAVNTVAREVPDVLATWFGASLGCEGFRHYGVFDDGRLVSTGAMRVTGRTAWFGYGATLPEYRGRGMQTATLTRRINDAGAMGATLLHTETSAGSVEEPNPSLLAMYRVGFERSYDKSFFSPAEEQ